MTVPARRMALALSDRALAALLAPLAALGSMAQNLLLPVLPAMRADLHATVAAANLTGSAALAAYATGLLIGGTLSDRFGRRVLMLTGTGVFLAGCFACAFAPSIGWLVAARIVQALGSSICMVTARAIVGDVYPRESMARMLAFLTMLIMVSPTIAPIIGGAVGEALGWRAVFWVLIVATVPILLLTWYKLPETRTREARHATGSLGTLLRQGAHMLRDREFVASVMLSSIIYTAFLVFAWTTPYVMQDQHLSMTAYGWWNLFVTIGYFTGNWLVTVYNSRFGMRALIRTGLLLQFLGAALAFGLAEWGPAGPMATPLGMFAPVGLMVFGQGLALPNIIATGVALHPEASGTASSLMGFLQQVTAAIAVQVMGAFPTDTARPVMRFVLACAVVSLMLLWARRRAPAVESG